MFGGDCNTSSRGCFLVDSKYFQAERVLENGFRTTAHLKADLQISGCFFMNHSFSPALIQMIFRLDIDLTHFQ